MTALWRFLRGIPALAYALAGCVVIGGALVAWQESRVSSAYQQGRTDERNDAHFDSTLVALVDSGRARASVRVDTIRDTVRVRVDRVRDVIVRVPDSIRVLVPVVDTLVIESRALASAVDSLARALDAERAANALALTVSRDATVSLRLAKVSLEGQLLSLQKRPTRAQAVLLSLASAGVGVAAGKWALR